MTPVQTELLLQVNGTQAAFGIEFVRSRRQICIAGSSSRQRRRAFPWLVAVTARQPAVRRLLSDRPHRQPCTWARNKGRRRRRCWITSNATASRLSAATQEVYPDEGDLDMVQVARTLREVGYSGMVMPDHMLSHPDDPRSL